MLIGVGYGLFLPEKPVNSAIEHAKGEATSSMEGHAAMAMGKRSGSWRDRMTSRKGWISISHYYVMKWTMVWTDILSGLLIAGALGA